MKTLVKYFIVLIALFAVCFTTVDAKETSSKKTTTTKETKKEKVNVYLFRRTGCGYCAREMQFLSSIYEEYADKINIVVYNIYEEGNRPLIQAVADEFKISIQGVPFTVVGSKYKEGYTAEWDEDFKALFEEAYNSQVKDVVAGLISKNKFKELNATTLKEAMASEGLEYNSNSNTTNNGENNTNASKDESKKGNTIFLCVFAGCAVALGTLIYFSRKNN